MSGSLPTSALAGEPGRARFEFRNLDGQSLVVVPASDGAIEQVMLGGLRCKAPACSGVACR